MEDKTRIEWVDFARGIVMLLVIWGHLDTNHIAFFTWTNAIKLPGFFAISGYFFSINGNRLSVLLKKKIRALIIPYFFLGGFSITVSYALKIINGETFSPKLILSFILGKEFWFIPCLFVSFIILILIFKIFTEKIKHIIVVSAVLLFIGCITIRPGVIRIWRWDTALIAQFFVMFGYVYKNIIEPNIVKFLNEKTTALVVTIIYIGLILISMNSKHGFFMDMNLNEYSNIVFCLLVCLVGILLLFSVSRLIFNNMNPCCNFIEFVGKNTLCYFILSFQCMHLTERFVMVFQNKFFLLRNYLILDAVVFVFLCFELAIISVIVNKYVPFIIGKRE